MIQKIVSQRVELPPIYLAEDKADLEKLPKGIPYIFAPKEELKFITIFLEFNILYKSAMKTKIPINWLNILNKLGYKATRTYELSSGGEYDESSKGNRIITVDEFVEDTYIVDFDKLSDLKILPKWLDDIKESIQTNIIDEVTFDPTAFNKQLGMNIGAGTIKHNAKNLLILDVSGSIPKGVVKTITALAKLMSKKFYADVMITSGQTVLIDYNDVFDTDIVAKAEESGSGNEGAMYKEIVEQHKNYGTVICFGDDDCPVRYGKTGELKPNFKIDTIYSLHTDCARTDNLTGYCKHLKADNIVVVKDWVNSIK